MDKLISGIVKSTLPILGILIAFLLAAGTIRNGFSFILGLNMTGAVPLAFVVLVLGLIASLVIFLVSLKSFIKLWN